MAKRTLDKAIASKKPTEITLSGRLKAERYTAEEIERLAGMPSLTSVEIDWQEIESLPPALAQLPNLEKLVISRCTSLASLVGIEKLVHLRELHLGELHMNLKRELGRLADLPDLSTLVLSSRKIELPPPAAMHSVIELRLVNAPRVDLTKAFTALAKQQSLRTLEVDTWTSSFVTPASVGKLQQLQRLTLSTRNLTLPPAIGELDKLEALTLRWLRKIPEEIFECTSLIELRLDGKFKSVPASIAKLEQLRTLKLPWRGNYDVPDALFGMNLKTFEGPDEIAKRIGRGAQSADTDEDLEDLESYDFTFGDLAAELTKLARAPKLTALHLGCADAMDVPAEIGKLTKLTDLVIVQPETTGISPKIGELGNLKTLRLWSEKLKTLPATIGNLKSLELLDVRAHPGLKIPSTIGALDNLTCLLANTELPKGIAKCRALAEIFWMIEQAPPETSLDALGKLAALRMLQIVHAKLVDLDAINRAFADSVLERLDLGSADTKGNDLSKLTGLRQVTISEAAADKLRLCDGKWSRTQERKGIARFRRRVAGRRRTANKPLQEPSPQ